MFTNLYNYVTSRGIVVPQTSAVRSDVETAFRTIFGADLDISAETAAGRLVEALTLTFVDVLGVNAQNANSFNPSVAEGVYLDAIGNLFGIQRLTGETDNLFRKRIVNSQSRGTGYPQSIRQAISQLGSKVNSICVLENGYSYPIVLPNQECGIAVAPHSIFVCVGDDNTDDTINQQIAQKIYSAKSAGCGYTDSAEYGTVQSVTITDAATGSSNVVKFYKPTDVTVTVEATVRGTAYTGTDIVADTQAAINGVVAGNNTATVITTGELISTIAASGNGIVCTAAAFKLAGSSEELSSVTALPYQRLVVSTITVTVI